MPVGVVRRGFWPETCEWFGPVSKGAVMETLSYYRICERLNGIHWDRRGTP